jgi:UDP:flavonoid glycosyltransferase YjiC (YdhE family)
MRIAIIALGSRGDVQPYIALGKGLKKSGHTIRLVTHQNFEELVNLHGLEFWSVEGSVQDIAQSKEMQGHIEKGNFLSVMSQMRKEATKGAIKLAKVGMEACKNTNLIIAGIGGLFSGIALAEKLEIPFIQAYYIPFTPTKSFPSFLFPKLPFHSGGFLNRFTYSIARQIIWQGYKSADNLSRKQVLKLPPASFFGPYKSDLFNHNPVLYGFSPSVIPKPYDWGNNIYITGYWLLEHEDNWEPSSELLEFIKSGTKPIYVGFGSMSSRKPEETADIVLNAIVKTKQRTIMLTGWGGLQKANLPDNVFMIDSIPISWLFPHVSVAIHHGGAGTTAEALKAGIPSIVIPFFGDQFYWGKRVFELGVGPEPIPRKKLTAERLAQAIQETVTNQAMCQRASNLGAKIRMEDGVANAIAVIQELESNKLKLNKYKD